MLVGMPAPTSVAFSAGGVADRCGLAHRHPPWCCVSPHRRWWGVTRIGMGNPRHTVGITYLTNRGRVGRRSCRTSANARAGEPLLGSSLIFAMALAAQVNPPATPAPQSPERERPEPGCAACGPVSSGSDSGPSWDRAGQVRLPRQGLVTPGAGARGPSHMAH